MLWYPTDRPPKPNGPRGPDGSSPAVRRAPAACQDAPMDLEPGEARFVPAVDGSSIIAASGEIDVATAPDLTAALDLMIDRGATAISVDMEHVTFIDSSGLGALVTALKRAQQTDATLTLVNLSGSARKVFEITGLLETFGADGAQA